MTENIKRGLERNISTLKPHERKLLDEHDELCRVEKFAEQLSAQLTTAGSSPRVDRLLSWLQARIASLTDVATPESLERRLEGERLFDTD